MILDKKRILIVTEYFYPEEFKINDVAFEWKNKGYRVDVLTQFPTYPYGKVYDGYKNRWYRKEQYNGINIHRVRAVTGYKDSLFKKLLKYIAFMALGSIYSLFNGKKYDYVFGYDIAALTCMVPAVLINRLYKKKVTLWIQDVWPDSVYAYGFKKTKILSLFLNRFVRSTYKNTSNFAASSPGFIKKIQLYANSEKEIKFLPNWADDINSKSESFQFSLDNKLHFTFAGNIGTVQNLENIIESFGQLPQEYLDKAQLNIIGDGSFKNHLENIVETFKYRNIVFWGKKDRKDIGKYLNGSDFLIVSLTDKPIFSITIPAKLQTYIAAGKPIFAIINGDVASIVSNNNLGLCADPSDIKAISLGFQKLIDLDEAERTKLVEKSDYLTRTLFNKEQIISSLENLLVGK